MKEKTYIFRSLRPLRHRGRGWNEFKTAPIIVCGKVLALFILLFCFVNEIFKKVFSMTKKRVKICKYTYMHVSKGYSSGRATKLTPIDRSGLYFCISISSFDEKKSFVLSSSGGLTSPPLLLVRPLKKNCSSLCNSSCM